MVHYKLTNSKTNINDTTTTTTTTTTTYYC